MNKVLFILVIYRIAKQQSAAYRSLCQWLSAQEMEDCVYVHDNTINNEFLSGAYNKGLQRAKERGKMWIVLLDADTCISQEYILFIRNLKNEVDVYVPILQNSKEKTLSPFWYDKRRGPFFRKYHSAKKNHLLTAFNSGVILRTDCMEDLGGFSQSYPLDYLDYWLFRKLDFYNKKVEIMPIKLKHELSVEKYGNVSKERYMSILFSERLFAEEIGEMAIKYYRLRLLFRWIKWYLIGHKYAKETLKAWLK